MSNNYAKGRRNEYKSSAWLEEQGYVVVRSAGSKTMWDLIAINDDHIMLIQVRSNRPPSRAEMAVMASMPGPKWVKREIHLWKDGSKLPEVRAIESTARRAA